MVLKIFFKENFRQRLDPIVEAFSSTLSTDGPGERSLSLSQMCKAGGIGCTFMQAELAQNSDSPEQREGTQKVGDDVSVQGSAYDLDQG
jgi:hypothetical protein